MTELRSMPLYVDDFEADTAHLSLEEDGAYNRLLRLCWRTPGCSIPDDPAWITRKMRVDQETYERVIVPVLDEFFTRRKGRLLQKRLVSEFGKAKAYKEAKSEAGKKGAKALHSRKPLKPNGTDPDRGTNSPEAKAPSAKPSATPSAMPSNSISNSNSSRAESALPREAFLDQVREAANAPETPRWSSDFELGIVVAGWLRGLSELQIIDALRSRSSIRPSTPTYFDGLMRDLAEKARGSPSAVKPNGQAKAHPDQRDGETYGACLRRLMAEQDAEIERRKAALKVGQA